MSIGSSLGRAVVACALGAVVLHGGPALAASTATLTTDVRVGNSGTLGGTATFQRTLQADGTEVLVARAQVLRPSVESSICLSDQPFRHRQDWQPCPHKTEQTSDVSYSMPLGTMYAGRVLHVQFRIRMPEFPDRPDLANGYAGWHPAGTSEDQYGEVALAVPTAPSPSPTPTTSPTGSPTTSPTASPTVSPTTSPTASPSTSPTASASATSGGSPTPGPTPSAASSGVAGATLGPIAVNAGSGGGAAPRPPVFLVVLLVAGLALAATSGRRLARRG